MSIIKNNKKSIKNERTKIEYEFHTTSLISNSDFTRNRLFTKPENTRNTFMERYYALIPQATVELDSVSRSMYKNINNVFTNITTRLYSFKKVFKDFKYVFMLYFNNEREKELNPKIMKEI